MNSAPNRYTLFVSDLFLYHGGVSDYTDHFAQQLYRKSKLKTVVTPYASPIKRDYSVTIFDLDPVRKPGHLDRWIISSKIRTLFYYVRLYMKAYRGLKKLALQKKADCIIFTEYYTFPFDIIIFCARRLKIRYALVFHGLDLICANNERFAHFEENFKKADFIIYNSEATRMLALELFPEKQEPAMILYPGIDVNALEKFMGPDNPFRSLSVNQDEIIFATVSRLVKRKGIDIAIRIVHALAKANIPVRYYIGGTGGEANTLRALVKELEAEEYIFFLGEISHEEKYQLLGASEFFLFPNHSSVHRDFEGFGISCIEASFFGNVIIGGKHGGVKEAVVDGETGFLFDFDDPSSIHKALTIIKNCIHTAELRARIKKRGMDYVRAKYDWNRLIDHFIQSERRIFAA